MKTNRILGPENIILLKNTDLTFINESNTNELSPNKIKIRNESKVGYISYVCKKGNSKDLITKIIDRLQAH